MAGNNIDLGIQVQGTIEALDRTIGRVNALQESLKKLPASTAQDRFADQQKQMAQEMGKAKEVAEKLVNTLGKYHSLQKMMQSNAGKKVGIMGAIAPREDQAKLKALRNEIEELIKDAQIANNAISALAVKATPSNDASLEAESLRQDLQTGALNRGVAVDSTREELAAGARRREERLAGQIDYHRRWQLNRERAHEKALEENQKFDARLAQQEEQAKERRLKQQNRADVARFNAKQKAINERERLEQKEFNDQIRRIKQMQQLGQKLNKDDEETVHILQRKIKAKKELTAEERKLATAIQITNKHVKLQNGVLKKGMNAIDEIRLGVSRLRNATLLYAFATEFLIAPARAMITTMTDFEGATLGATRVGEKFGISSNRIKKAIEGLTNDGLLKVTDASKGLRNLLSSGIGLPDAVRLMETFKDAAAFNRQGSLEFGEAIVGATEGVKNMNSRMVDNAGISKNLSIIIKEYAASLGRSTASLSEAEKQQAVVNGLIKEGSVFAGDASKALNSLGGAYDRLAVNAERATRKVGEFFEENTGVFSNVANVFNLLSDLTTGGVASQSGALKFFGMSDAEIEQRAKQTREKLQKTFNPFLSDEGPAAWPWFNEKSGYAFMPGLQNISTLETLIFGKQIEKIHKATDSTNKLREFSKVFDAEKTKDFAQASVNLAQKLKALTEEAKLASGVMAKFSDNPILMQRAFLAFSSDIDKVLQSLKDLSPEASEAIQKLFMSEAAKGGASSVLSDKAQSFIDKFQNQLERFANKENIDRFDREIAQNTTTVTQWIDTRKKKGPELQIPKEQIEELAKAAEQILKKVNDTTNIKRVDFFAEKIQKLNAAIAGDMAKGTQNQFQRQRDQAQNTLDKRLKDLSEAGEGGTLFLDEINKVFNDAQAAYRKQIARVNEEERQYLESIAHKQSIDQFKEVQKRKNKEAELELKRMKEVEGWRKELNQTTHEGRMYAIREAYNVQLYLIDELEKAYGGLPPGMRDLLRGEATQQRDRSVLEEKLNKVSEEMRDMKLVSDQLQTGINNIGTAFQAASDVGLGSFNRLQRRISRTATAIDSATQAVDQLRRAKVLLDSSTALGTLGGIATGAGAVALAATAAFSIYGAITGDKREEENERERRKSGRFGSTVSRGPQTININPTLAVQADGDVFFSQDSESVIRDRLIGLVQQSIDDGEIEFGNIRG